MSSAGADGRVFGSKPARSARRGDDAFHRAGVRARPEPSSPTATEDAPVCTGIDKVGAVVAAVACNAAPPLTSGSAAYNEGPYPNGGAITIRGPSAGVAAVDCVAGPGRAAGSCVGAAAT